RLCRHSIRKWETSSDAVPGAMYLHLCRAVDDGEGARFSAMRTRGMSRSPNLRGSYNGSPLGCQVTSTSTASHDAEQMNLHFAEFQGSTCACCPFRLSIVGKILPPALRRFLVPTSSLNKSARLNMSA